MRKAADASRKRFSCSGVKPEGGLYSFLRSYSCSYLKDARTSKKQLSVRIGSSTQNKTELQSQKQPKSRVNVEQGQRAKIHKDNYINIWRWRKANTNSSSQIHLGMLLTRGGWSDCVVDCERWSKCAVAKKHKNEPPPTDLPNISSVKKDDTWQQFIFVTRKRKTTREHAMSIVYVYVYVWLLSFKQKKRKQENCVFCLLVHCSHQQLETTTPSFGYSSIGSS